MVKVLVGVPPVAFSHEVVAEVYLPLRLFHALDLPEPFLELHEGALRGASHRSLLNFVFHEKPNKLKNLANALRQFEHSHLLEELALENFAPREGFRLVVNHARPVELVIH